MPHLFLSHKPLLFIKKEIKNIFFTKKDNIVLITEKRIEVYSKFQNLLKSLLIVDDYSRDFVFPNKEKFAHVTPNKVSIYDIDTLEMQKEIKIASERGSKFLFVNDSTLCFPLIKPTCVIIDINKTEFKNIKLEKMEECCVKRLVNELFVFIYKNNFEVWNLLKGTCEKK